MVIPMGLWAVYLSDIYVSFQRFLEDRIQPPPTAIDISMATSEIAKTQPANFILCKSHHEMLTLNENQYPLD